MYTYPDYLAHYGVKGMKWGVVHERESLGSRFRNRNKIYDDNPRIQKVKKDRDRLAIENKKISDKLKHTKSKAQYDSLTKKYLKNKETLHQLEEQYDREKILAKINSKPKSKYRTNIENKYKSLGMSDDDAVIAAHKRIQSEKMVAAAIGVSAAIVIGYGIKRHYIENSKEWISEGTEFQRIGNNPNPNHKNRPFYASNNKRDNLKYMGAYGNQIVERGDVYKETIKASKNIKVANRTEAYKTFKNLYDNDPEFRENTTKYLEGLVNGQAIGEIAGGRAKIAGRDYAGNRKILKDLKNGKITEKTYELFNVSLVVHTDEANASHKKFYDTLAKNGYGAIKDLNDIRYTGYSSKSPFIVFSNDVRTDSVVKIPAADIPVLKAYRAIHTDHLLNSIPKNFAYASLGLSGVNYVSTSGRIASDNRIVQNYLKEHPNTNKTYDEILDSYRDSTRK